MSFICEKLLRGVVNVNIFICGVPKSGKTTLSKLLKKELYDFENFYIVEIDVEKKLME